MAGGVSELLHAREVWGRVVGRNHPEHGAQIGGEYARRSGRFLLVKIAATEGGDGRPTAAAAATWRGDVTCGGGGSSVLVGRTGRRESGGRGGAQRQLYESRVLWSRRGGGRRSTGCPCIVCGIGLCVVQEEGCVQERSEQVVAESEGRSCM